MINKNQLVAFVKSHSFLRVSFYFFDAFNRQLRNNLFKFFSSLRWYFKDYLSFKKQPQNNAAPLRPANLLPQLADKTNNTPLDKIYTLQNAWACRKLFEYKPTAHVDIGSSISAVAIMSQFVPTTMVDIREVDLQLENLYFRKGSILDLPFADESTESLSSICVVEHIGLGRYGDNIDSYGTEKSILEIQRVVKSEGMILLSVPVGSKNVVMFNAHREFNPTYFKNLLTQCQLVEEKYIIGNAIHDSFNATKSDVVGLFQFRKM